MYISAVTRAALSSLRADLLPYHPAFFLLAKQPGPFSAANEEAASPEEALASECRMHVRGLESRQDLVQYLAGPASSSNLGVRIHGWWNAERSIVGHRPGRLGIKVRISNVPVENVKRPSRMGWMLESCWAREIPCSRSSPRFFSRTKVSGM